MTTTSTTTDAEVRELDGRWSQARSHIAAPRRQW
jgi:hypothetical protein